MRVQSIENGGLSASDEIGSVQMTSTHLDMVEIYFGI